MLYIHKRWVDLWIVDIYNYIYINKSLKSCFVVYSRERWDRCLTPRTCSREFHPARTGTRTKPSSPSITPNKYHQVSKPPPAIWTRACDIHLLVSRRLLCFKLLSIVKICVSIRLNDLQYIEYQTNPCRHKHTHRHATRWDGQISRAFVSHFGRLGNPNLAGSNPGQVKPMTLKLIHVTS